MTSRERAKVVCEAFCAKWATTIATPADRDIAEKAGKPIRLNGQELWFLQESHDLFQRMIATAIDEAVAEAKK